LALGAVIVETPAATRRCSSRSYCCPKGREGLLGGRSPRVVAERGRRRQAGEDDGGRDDRTGGSAGADLRAEHRRLWAEIERLEREARPSVAETRR
jgi:hypothetical protein